ncbi:TPA: 50S ribosome-binding GTPase [archaeon]|uniref:50S ribosome-binding GTPase n=1 Tax=Candidatus Naiadarchaeum limnaeum TaxID=2756139 RepID=A0A832VAI9_9ARCH|nr:50S ribosome-binding GTPase [Candidatus Naiadarchaeum limnaeum]
MVSSFLRKLKLLFSSLFGRKKTITLGIYGEPNTGKTTLANKIALDWLGRSVGAVSDMPHETRTIQKAEHVEVKAGSKKIVMNLLDMPGLATHIDYKKFMQYHRTNSDSVKLERLKLSDLKKIAESVGVEADGGKSKFVRALKPKVDEGELKDLVQKLGIKISRSKGKKKKYTESEAKKIAEEATQGVVEAIKFLDKVDVVLAMMDATRDPLNQVNIMLVGNLEAKGIPLVIVANKTDLKSAKPENIKAAFPQHSVVPISALKGHNLEELYEIIATHV